MSYFGSKATSGLCQPIIAMMPPHDTYIETHLGGGAIMKRKPPALTNIGIDIDPQPLADFTCDYPVQKVNGCAHRFLAEDQPERVEELLEGRKSRMTAMNKMWVEEELSFIKKMREGESLSE